MINLVFFLEEPSAREMLKVFLPNLFLDINTKLNFIFIVFEGKSDLEKQIENKLKSWNKPNCKFIILRDKDSGNCCNIKSELVQKCINAGKNCLVRIACYELESWYIEDLKAVEKAFKINGLSAKQYKEKYRQPDNLSKPSTELEILTKYQYQKVSGSKKIGTYLSTTKNTSHSFNVFISGLKNMVANQI
ncbi:MAG: DUF4276 family protein [Candidatus Wallbacteria bacterium]